MKRVRHILKFMSVVSVLLLAVWGCGSNGTESADVLDGATASVDANDSDSQSSTDGEVGTLSLSMVDAPGGSYQAVYVTLKEIQVCIRNPACDGTQDSEECECEWETIETLEETYNLLELVGGVMSSLGQKDLAPGDYNQMRLLLHDVPDESLNMFDEPHPFPQYLVDDEGAIHEMKVPSGYVSGIKLVHPFEIVEGLTTELILDFDVSESVVKAGNSGKYRLKPTIKVIGTYNRAIVSGVVSNDDESPLALEGATVAAWYQDGNSNWNAAMSTFTDAEGAYMLYLDLGGENELDPMGYRIVASADGYAPGCTDLTVEVDGTYPDTDFALSAANMITVEGAITGTLPPVTEDPLAYPEDAPVVTIGFNMTDGDCLYAPSVQTTVAEDNTDDDVFYNSDDGSFRFNYSVSLPEGAYDATASCEGLDPVPATIDLNGAASPVTQDFSF